MAYQSGTIAMSFESYEEINEKALSNKSEHLITNIDPSINTSLDIETSSPNALVPLSDYDDYIDHEQCQGTDLTIVAENELMDTSDNENQCYEQYLIQNQLEPLYSKNLPFFLFVLKMAYEMI